MPRKKTPNKTPKQTTCPNCGYCEHCGRAASPPRPVPVWVWPSYPPQYPWYVYPTITTSGGTFVSGTVTVTNADIPAVGNTINVPSVWSNPNSSGFDNWSFTAGGTD